jgi:chromosome segregation ATPase
LRGAVERGREAFEADLKRERQRADEIARVSAEAEARQASERAEAAALQGALDRSREQLAAMATQIDDVQAANEALARQLHEERERVLDLQQKNGDTAAELENSQAQREALDHQAEDAAKRLALAEQREADASADLRQALARAEERLAALDRGGQDALAAVESELDAERSRREALQQRLDEIERQASSAADEECEAQASRDEVQRELLAAREDAQTAGTNLHAALSRIDEMIADQTAADKERNELTRALEAITRERDLLRLDLEVARQPLSAPEEEPPVEAAEPRRDEKKAASKGRKGSSAGRPAVPREATEDGWTAVPLETRYAFPQKFEVQVNGNASWLCDLSMSGCQILATGTLKPGQPIKLLLPSDPKPLLCVGKVVWAQLEPPAKGRALAYRAGVQFTKADGSAVEQFAVAHGTSA